MYDRKRIWWMNCAVVVCVASGLSLSTARTYGDEPKQDEKKQAEPAKDAPKTDAPSDDQPVPEKMTPRRTSREAAPTPTVTLAPGEAPIATFDTPVHDFGRTRAGTEVKYDYTFRNTGTGPLEILKVKPGCGCTTAGEHTRIVQPDEEGVIPIKLRPGDHAGPVDKRITVTTNSPIKEIVTLEIKGTVWSPIQVTPRSAAFGRLTPDRVSTGTTRNLTIVNNLDDPMKPGSVTSSSDAFVGELKPVEEGKKYELVVTLTDKVVGGNNSAKLTIDTGLVDPKVIDVQAYAFMSPPVDVTPAKLVLPKPRSAELVRTFYIRSNTANPLEVTDLKCTTDALKLELVDLRGDKRTYRLSVTIPADYDPPAQGDEISFKTDDASMPIGTIPVTGTFTTGDPAMPTNS